MGHYPKAWADRGDGTTYVSKDPRKAIGLSMEALVNSQGGKRRKPFVDFKGEETTISDTSCKVEYVQMNAPDEFREQMQEWREQGRHVLGGIKKVADPAVMGSLCSEWLAIS